jgi:hypothetical protein
MAMISRGGSSGRGTGARGGGKACRVKSGNLCPFAATLARSLRRFLRSFPLVATAEIAKTSLDF